jgi:hypothetical protein
VLSSLFSSAAADAAWAAAKNGGAIFILEVLLPTGQAVPATERAAAASLLGKLVRDLFKLSGGSGEVRSEDKKASPKRFWPEVERWTRLAETGGIDK